MPFSISKGQKLVNTVSYKKLVIVISKKERTFPVCLVSRQIFTKCLCCIRVTCGPWSVYPLSFLWAYRAGDPWICPRPLPAVWGCHAHIVLLFSSFPILLIWSLNVSLCSLLCWIYFFIFFSQCGFLLFILLSFRWRICISLAAVNIC